MKTIRKDVFETTSNTHTFSNTYTDVDIGIRLRYERKKNRYTIDRLAKELGVPEDAIKGWEDSLSLPADRYVKKMSKLYNVSEKYLLGLEN